MEVGAFRALHPWRQYLCCGAADDKGQVWILVKAVEALMKRDGRLPVNVRFLIEGEEEVGGEHIESYVKQHPDRLKSDAAMICDTELFAPELPTLCIGLRGIVYGEIHVQAPITTSTPACTAALLRTRSKPLPKSSAH